MSTHLGAAPGAVSPRVLLPGDPRRAQWIAETFLDEAECYSTVRNMLGFTGSYRGVPVSVQGSGMGQPSAAIYVTELFTEYDVQQVVRVGTCGALSEDLALRDVVLAISAATDASTNRLRFEGLDFCPPADFALLQAAHDAAVGRDRPVSVGQVFSTDSFYNDRSDLTWRLAEYGVLAVEMETNALYTLAAKHTRSALTICTVSDHIKTGEQTTADEREKTFGDMVELALDAMLAVPL
ncbi:MAG: purine-nucleoside phosphorylase [Propionibacteriales bacterium]|nr:purine-nucleoside phosphorylase [Propionibacteriales bacterium]